MVINVQEMIMKKIYICPELKVMQIMTTGMLATSGGVDTNSLLGNEYNSSDITYSPEFDFFDE